MIFPEFIRGSFFDFNKQLQAGITSATTRSYIRVYGVLALGGAVRLKDWGCSVREAKELRAHYATRRSHLGVTMVTAFRQSGGALSATVVRRK
jgi:hypothetical protein